MTTLRLSYGRLPVPYRRGLVVTLGIYVVLYGSLLVYTRGLPYVMDNNESFSALVHASNLYHFPLSRTFGLTDEAFSPNADAHPYVYTHQGNFPRLFAFVLFLLGARTIESQIVITTFTVGLLAIVLMYHYFAIVTTPLFAFIASAVAMTDYVFFVQWHVNTFRVWHVVFFFLALLCVHGIEGTGRRRWFVGTVLTFACLFYFELVFATFVTGMSSLYATLRNFRRPRLLVACWTAQAAGALLAVAVLVGQLVAYLGWADFLQDLQLTYTARNLMAQDSTYVDRVRAFVESRHLVFWYNFATVQYERSPFEILSSLARGYFTAYTPTLWYVVGIVIAGWFGGLARQRAVMSLPAGGILPAEDRHIRPASRTAVVLLLISWTRFLLGVVQDEAMFGVGEQRLVANVGEAPWLVLPAATVVAVACIGFVGRVTTGDWLGVRRLSTTRLVVAAATLLVAELIVMKSGALFEPFYQPLWLHVHETWFPGWLVQLAVIVSGGVAVLLSLNAFLGADTRWLSLAAFMGCAVVAYAVVYSLSPGYIHSGYLERWAPFGSFVFQAAIGLTTYVAWHAGTFPLAHLLARRPQTSPSRFVPPKTKAFALATAARRNREFALVLRLRSSRPFIRGMIRLPAIPSPWLATTAAAMLVATMAMARATARVVPRLAAATCLAILLFPAIFWVALQLTYTRLLPATHFQFIKQLRQVPFRSASFAADTYAAPIYAHTGQWAYFDTRLGLSDGGVVSLTGRGYTVNRDARSYLWMADREHNDAYLRPEYFLCFRYQFLSTVVSVLLSDDGGCSATGIVKYAGDPTTLSVAERVVAQDPTERNTWAIVKLNWHPLEGLSADQARRE